MNSMDSTQIPQGGFLSLSKNNHIYLDLTNRLKKSQDETDPSLSADSDFNIDMSSDPDSWISKLQHRILEEWKAKREVQKAKNKQQQIKQIEHASMISQFQEKYKNWVEEKESEIGQSSSVA